MAAKYYKKLVKEYAVVDLSRYKEGKVGMRWRTEKEVISGKGQFECASLTCEHSRGLRSYEVPFVYKEQGETKKVRYDLLRLVACLLLYSQRHSRHHCIYLAGLMVLHASVGTASPLPCCTGDLLALRMRFDCLGLSSVVRAILHGCHGRNQCVPAEKPALLITCLLHPASPEGSRLLMSVYSSSQQRTTLCRRWSKSASAKSVLRNSTGRRPRSWQGCPSCCQSTMKRHRPLATAQA